MGRIFWARVRVCVFGYLPFFLYLPPAFGPDFEARVKVIFLLFRVGHRKSSALFPGAKCEERSISTLLSMSVSDSVTRSLRLYFHYLSI